MWASAYYAKKEQEILYSPGLSMNVKKLLLTSDLSEEALRPLEGVRALASNLGLEVTILHVVEIVAVAPPGGPMAPPIRPADVAGEEASARKLLEEQAAKLTDLKVSVDVVHAQDVAGTICDYAKENGFDMIALSTHGRSGFRRLVLGSVAEQILRHSEVPVLVFPRKH